MDETTDTYDSELDLVDVEASDVYNDVVTGLENEVGSPLYPGDERRIFAEALVSVLLAYVSKANDASRQTMIRFARGQVLDAIGERLGVERIPASPATTTLQFSLSAPQSVAITIPALTRATDDGTVYWQTDEPLVIPSGSTVGTVQASCSVAGEEGNGQPVGSIATIVDLQPYVQSVTNTTVTAGGDDGEPYTEQGDDRFRERIRLAPNRLSTAGPEEAYVYWALTADPGIIDVAAFSEEYDDEMTVDVAGGKAYVGGDLLQPDVMLTVNGGTTDFTYEYENSLLTITLTGSLASESTVDVTVHRLMDGRVKVVPLMEGGQLPDEETLQAVEDAVNDRTVRPMTDLVTVSAPTQVEYGISLQYWTTYDEEAAVVQAVEGAGGAIERYVSDQCSKLGRNVNPDMLMSYVMQAGALRCEVTEPAYTEVGKTQVASFNGSKTVSHSIEQQARWDE